MISSSPTRRGINIFAAEGAPVVAVNDGVILKIGQLRAARPLRRPRRRLRQPLHLRRSSARSSASTAPVVMPTGEEKRVPVDSENIRPRLYALPERVERRASATQAERESRRRRRRPAPTERIKVGSKVIAGTVLGPDRRRAEDGVDPHINFSIRPAGRGAPRIDPKPILDGWKLLEATAIYRAKGKNPFAAKLSGAGVLLLSKEALQRRVLADERLESPTAAASKSAPARSTAACWRCSTTSPSRASA